MVVVVVILDLINYYYCYFILSRNGPLDVPDDFKERMDKIYFITSAFNVSKPWKNKNKFSYSKEYTKDRKRKHKQQNIISLEDDFIDEDDDQIEEDFVENKKPYTHKSLTLDLYIKKEKKNKKRNSSTHLEETENLPIYDEKGSCIFIDDSDVFTKYMVQLSNKTNNDLKDRGKIENKLCANISLNNLKLKCKQVKCLVNNEDIRSDYLSNIFDEQYIEGSCSPRQFIIINNSFSYNDIIMSVKVETDEKVSICDNVVVHIKLMNVTNNFIECTEEIFRENILDFQLLLDMCFPRCDADVIKISTDRGGCAREVKRCFTKAIADTESMSDICKRLFIRAQARSVPLETTNIDSYPMCPVCFVRVNKWTCLNACSHQVCHSCWELYVDSNVKSGCYELSCPYTDCTASVDIPTVVGFLDLTLVSKFVEKCCELFVMHTKQMKFCPSPSCQMVAVGRINSPVYSKPIFDYKSAMTSEAKTILVNNSSVNCPSCKKSWCFSCQRPAHWPSSCTANKIYQSRIKKDYDLLYDEKGKLYEAIAACKRCPSCRFLITKRGGCINMTCRCGFAFCWDCLQQHRGNVVTCTNKKNLKLAVFVVDEYIVTNKIPRLVENAIYFNLQAKSVTIIKQNLKNSAKDCLSEFFVQAMSKALDMLVTGYNLLKNLSAAVVVCKSRYQFRRIGKFVYVCGSDIKALHGLVDKEDLNEITLEDVVRAMRKVELCLEKLHDLKWDWQQVHTVLR